MGLLALIGNGVGFAYTHPGSAPTASATSTLPRCPGLKPKRTSWTSRVLLQKPRSKIAACAVAAHANDTAVQGPAVVGSGSTWMWGAVRTAQEAGMPHQHNFDGPPPGSPNGPLPGSTTSTPTRSITSSPTPPDAHNSSQFSDPRI
jgi:hypothetical protein